MMYRKVFAFLIMLANLSPYVMATQSQPKHQQKVQSITTIMQQQQQQQQQQQEKSEQQHGHQHQHQHHNEYEHEHEPYIWHMPKLSEGRIQELHNMAIRLEHSIDLDKYVCDSYYDYVCGRNRPLFSILGHLPPTTEIIQLMIQLQDDREQFEAKRKLFDFFISCNIIKSLEDCYIESFVHFKPLFGYIILKYHIHSNSYEWKTFLELLEKFLIKAESTEYFTRDMLRIKLTTLREKFRILHVYFRTSELNYAYHNLRIHRESYRHNVKNLELYNKSNTTFGLYGIPKIMLNWCLYLYQSHNKPLSYFYATFNVHLWMTLFNITERYYEPQRFIEIGDCLKLPQFVNVLEEARILAVVYLKSFRNTWEEYRDWITSSPQHADIYDQENAILKQYNLNNKKIFFTLYAQNFCDFGKDLAENIFYLGLKQNDDFFNIYSCGYHTQKSLDCI